MITLYDDFDSFSNSISVEYDNLLNLTNTLNYLENLKYEVISKESFTNDFDTVLLNLKNISHEDITFEGLSDIGEKIKYVISKIYKYIKSVLVKIKNIIIKAFTAIMNLIRKMIGQTNTVKERIDNIKIKFPNLYKKPVKINTVDDILKDNMHIIFSTKDGILDIHKGLNRLARHIAVFSNIMEVIFPGLEVGRELIKDAVLIRSEYDDVINTMGSKVLSLVEEYSGSLMNKDLALQILERQGDRGNRYAYVAPISLNHGIVHFMYIRKETTGRIEVYYGEGDIHSTDFHRRFRNDTKCSLEDLDKILTNIEKDTELVNLALSNLEKAQKRTADRLELLLEAANNRLNNRTILEPFPSLCRDLVAYSNNTASVLITKEYMNLVSYTGKALGESVKMITTLYNIIAEELKDEE